MEYLIHEHGFYEYGADIRFLLFIASVPSENPPVFILWDRLDAA